MHRICMQLLLWLLPTLMIGQANLNGVIRSGNQGIRNSLVGIEGAEVAIPELKIVTFTNNEGQYAFQNVPRGKYSLILRAVGHESMTYDIDVADEDLILDYTLTKISILEDVLITSLRASEKTATTFSSLNKEEIAKQNFGQDFPFLLNQLASTVVTSDAGVGVGYTGIRVRGSDPTRINVTVNGIPLNDSESHGVFWVNLPDLASSVNSVQVQRGVGTSTNGAAAFGASVNIETRTAALNPYAEFNNSAGSFNTFKNTLSAGTGLMDNGFAFDLRLSNIQSDGWVDRASSDLQSWFASGAYYGKKGFVKANIFSGRERTYQSWWGVPEAIIDGDEEALLTHYFNNVGVTYLTPEDSINLFNSDRRYNYYTYPNQVDNYSQTHYQLLYGYEFNDQLSLSGAFHYTKGQGFFEEYREEDPFAAYPVLGVTELLINENLLTTTDLVRRRWLDNDFYGAVFSLDYRPSSSFEFSLGGGINQYDGDHFGEVIWARFAGNSETEDQYYNNRSLKTDGHLYAKGLWQISEKFSAYVDLQVRNIDYVLGDSTLDGTGTDEGQIPIKGDFNYLFFNPKLGLTYQLGQKSQVYASLSVGNREPVRSDFINSPTDEEPTHETLYDVEAGYRYSFGKLTLSANAYYMYYQNQLVLTGALNDVGANIRQNVDASYRAGIEVVAQTKLTDWLNWGFNFTLSQNKILNFDEIVYDYAVFPANIETNSFTNTDISFSPNVIAGSQLVFVPIKGLDIAILSKYVGRQFLDNTSNVGRSIDPWFVNDLRINYQPSFVKGVTLGLLINNALDSQYEANGYTFSYRFGDLITENFYYPQAGRNFLLSLGLSF
ncbi:MAG: TonB-dependent receptor [Bacteroidia bacterium]|nr:TonB-dependent receptor [Bacteroidia bacterium]